MALCLGEGDIGLGVLLYKCDNLELVRPLCTQQYCTMGSLCRLESQRCYVCTSVGDPDPLVRDTDPDPSIVKQDSKKP